MHMFVLIIVLNFSQLPMQVMVDTQLYLSRDDCESAYRRDAGQYRSYPHFCELIWVPR